MTAQLEQSASASAAAACTLAVCKRRALAAAPTAASAAAAAGLALADCCCIAAAGKCLLAAAWELLLCCLTRRAPRAQAARFPRFQNPVSPGDVLRGAGQACSAPSCCMGAQHGTACPPASALYQVRNFVEFWGENGGCPETKTLFGTALDNWRSECASICEGVYSAMHARVLRNELKSKVGHVVFPGLGLQTCALFSAVAQGWCTSQATGTWAAQMCHVFQAARASPHTSMRGSRLGPQSSGCAGSQ